MLSGELFEQAIMSMPVMPETDGLQSELIENLPTPTTMDHLPPRSQEALKKQMNGSRKGRTQLGTLREAVNPKKSGNVQKNASDSYIKRLQREAERGIQREGLWPEPTRRLDPYWKRWGVESQIYRNDDGVSSGLFTNRASRLKLLGNAVIPACAAIPLQRVLDLENDS